MSKSDAFEADFLKLIFNAVAIASLADNAASAPLTNLYVAFHTADPLDAGVQTANEISYTGYARVAVPRTTGAWTVSGTSPTVVNPVAPINGPASTGGTGGVITHWSVGTASAGATKILYSGTVSPNITVTSGVTPSLTTATAITED